MSTDERGGGTLLVAGVLVVLAAVAFAGIWIAGWLGSASRAAAVADLSAQAAGEAFANGKEPCAVAARTARENSASLVACKLEGDEFGFAVTVKIAAQLTPRIPGAPVEVKAAATAGSVP